jgi:abortive infection bacteriophage resistance protein
VTKVYNKPALTFEEQLIKLESRGLIITDHNLAKHQLSTISYYRLSAYCYPYRVRSAKGTIENKFVPNTLFSEVISLYEFDRHLRLLLMDAIERIEIHLRTTVTYHLGHKYGPLGYVKSQNFHPRFKHEVWLSKLQEEVSRSSDEFVNHFKRTYTGFPELPIWMITELMSLGSLSFCYKGMSHEDKRAIANPLNIHYKTLGDWLHTITYVRNVCSHHGRLWNRELAIRPETRSPDKNWHPPVTPRNDRIFYILLILRFLLRKTTPDDQWKTACEDLIKPFSNKIQWRAAMVLPQSWLEHPLWV